VQGRVERDDALPAAVLRASVEDARALLAHGMLVA
jgi:hypothetical protein